MGILKFDVCRLFISQKGLYFYFIRNNEDGIYDSKGMDLSSLVYFLLFKLRSFREDHVGYVRLLQKGEFDLREKPYFNENELIDLANDCLHDELFLYKNRTEEVDLSILNEFDELQTMSYVSRFNPRRNFYNGFYTYESGMKDVLRILTREKNFDNIMEKLLGILENTDEQNTVHPLMEIEDLKYLITGPNGDLWCNLFMKVNLPEFEKYRILYQAQPFKIFENKKSLKSVELVRCAIDGVKNNHQKMKSLFSKLPIEMQENSDILNFYNWHRECA